MIDANSHALTESSGGSPFLPIQPAAEELPDEPLEIVFAENAGLEETSPTAPEPAKTAIVPPLAQVPPES